MRLRLVLLSACVAGLGLLGLPGVARAQSAITGIVRDTSGAVLPGVTVEAASDALIEKTRTVVTDGDGVYRIVDLRPGTYAITFTLTGFATVRREGISLPAEFTATINSELRVGSLEETITVSGAAPIVDVSSTVRTQVLNRDVLDSLPTGRTIQGVGQLVVGVNLSIPDVGGSRAMQQTYMSTHGMTTANTTITIDGMMVNGLQSDGAVQSYFNDAMNQEVSYQTSGIGAETSAGGVRLNMIPRDGGNRFNGAFFSTWKDGKWQGDNLSQDLQDRGLLTRSAIERIYDFNFSQGGPIKTDKLWFFGSARAWSVNAPIANTFKSDGTPEGFNTCLRTKSCEQGIDDQKIKSAMLRLTWQASQRHKLAAYFDEIDKFRGHAMSAGDDYDTASVVWHSPAYSTGAAKWTSTLTNRLLLEGGYSRNLEYYTNEYQEGVEEPRGSAAWFAGASRSDLDLVARTRAPAAHTTQSPKRHFAMAALSYVTGSHNMKFGVQRTWGWFGHTRDHNADLVQQYRSNRTGVPFTVPNSVIIYNTPYQSAEVLSGDIGVYGQDQWAIKRLTLNFGLRFEHINAKVPAQTSPAGRWVGAREFAEIPDLPNWSNIAPRFGAAYDLFGNGKTALKFSLNRYNLARTTGVADNYNPLAVSSATLNWTDVNANDVAEGALRCAPYRSEGCEIDFSGLPASFGTVATARYDQATKRTYNVESSVELQHALTSRISANVAWFKGKFYDQTQRDNQNITLNDWTAYQVYNPMTGAPLTIYDLNADAKARQIDNLDTRASDPRAQTFESFNLSMNARLPLGATAFGGFDWSRSLENTCNEPDNPNLLRFCDDSNLEEGFSVPYRTQAKLSGSLPLPWAMQVSATFQSNPGARDLTPGLTTTDRTTGATTWLLSATTTYPTDCPAPCPAGQRVLPTLRGAPGSSNLTVRLTPFGADGKNQFQERINQVDLRITKSISLGRVRVIPQLEVFNLFNADTIILYRSNRFGTSTYLQPAGILNGRIIGIGAQARW